MVALRFSLRHICSSVRAPGPTFLNSRQLATALEADFRAQPAFAVGSPYVFASIGQAAVSQHTPSAARSLTVIARPDCRALGVSQSLPFQAIQLRGLKPPLRDPERPKRPDTAWLQYLAKFRETHKEKKGREVLTSASASWKSMTLEEKRPWEDAYHKKKAEFDAKYKEYVDSGKKDAWERPPGKPKKPPSAFFQYIAEYRAKNSHMKSTEVTRTAGALWKDMTPEQKKPYEEQYERSKAQYEKDLKAYGESGQEAAWKEKVGIADVERKAAAKKEAAAEKKRAAAEKKKAAAEKKKAAAEKKKKAAAEKKKAAAEKKKAAAEKKKKAAEEKKAAADKKKKAAEAKAAAPATKKAKAPAKAAAAAAA